ncbi:MAG TPA: hypothetical protein PKA02_03230 [Candidatus Saccharibacteria bacterium]|nr:hypothetical protein [Candidatus Saccharibacteria bacterium]
MIFVDGLGDPDKVGMLIDKPYAEELFEVGPKLSLSALSLVVQLYKADRSGAASIGASVSRGYLQKTAQRLRRDAPAHAPPPPTPPESPHYVEFGTPANDQPRGKLAIEILSFLSPPEPPQGNIDVTAPQ